MKKLRILLAILITVLAIGASSVFGCDCDEDDPKPPVGGLYTRSG